MQNTQNLLTLQYSHIDYELYKEVYSNRQILGQIASYYLLINKQTNQFRQIPILRLSEFEYGITSELGYSLYPNFKAAKTDSFK